MCHLVNSRPRSQFLEATISSIKPLRLDNYGQNRQHERVLPMAEVLKVTASRANEMQKNPQEYFRQARKAACKRAATQLKAEQQLANRNHPQSDYIHG